MRDFAPRKTAVTCVGSNSAAAGVPAGADAVGSAAVVGSAKFGSPGGGAKPLSSLSIPACIAETPCRVT